MKGRIPILIASLVLIAVAASSTTRAQTRDASQQAVLSQYCFACHNQLKEDGLVLSKYRG